MATLTSSRCTSASLKDAETSALYRLHRASHQDRFAEAPQTLSLAVSGLSSPLFGDDRLGVPAGLGGTSARERTPLDRSHHTRHTFLMKMDVSGRWNAHLRRASKKTPRYEREIAVCFCGQWMVLQTSPSNPRRLGYPDFLRESNMTRPLTIRLVQKLRTRRYRVPSARTLSSRTRPTTKRQAYQRGIHSRFAVSHRLRVRMLGPNPFRPGKIAVPSSTAGFTTRREVCGLPTVPPLRAHVSSTDPTSQTTSDNALRLALSLARHVARLSRLHRPPACLFPHRPTMSRQTS